MDTRQYLHAAIESERRRNRVLLCDMDRILPHTETINVSLFDVPYSPAAVEASGVTCPRCRRLLEHGTQRWDDEKGQWIDN